MKILFIPFYIQAPQHRMAASARLRAEWPAKYIPADIFQENMTVDDVRKYDIIIFQKCFNFKFQFLANELKDKVTVLDLCDPEWESRGDEVDAMVKLMSSITCPTRRMAEAIKERYKDKFVSVIIDGQDLEFHNKTKIHKDEPVKLVWYGNQNTIEALQKIMQELEKAGKPLKVICDKPGFEKLQYDKKKIDVEFVEWDLKTVNKEILECNVALNPKIDEPKYLYKSNNKTTKAWALGLPCITKDFEREIVRFSNWQERVISAAKGRKLVDEKYNNINTAKIWYNFLRSQYFWKKAQMLKGNNYEK